MADDLASDFQLPEIKKAARPEPGEASDFMLPGYEAPDVQKDWGKADFLTEVLPAAVRNAPQSALHQLTAIPEAIYHYDRTAEGMKMLGRGILSKTGMGGSEDPEQRAKDEAVVSAMVAPYTSWAGFKKSLATDPFEFLTTAGMALSGGATGASKVAKALASTGTTAGEYAAKGVSGLGKVAEGLSYAADPTKAALGLASGAVKYAALPAAARIAEQEAGINKPTLAQAFEAGKSRTPPKAPPGTIPEPDFKKSFNDYATGRGDPVAFSQGNAKAFNAMKADEIGEWAKDKANLAQLGDPVDFAPAYKAIQDFRNSIGPVQGGVGPEIRKAHDVLDQVESQLRFRDSLPVNYIQGFPQHDLLKTVEGVDQLKRSLYKDMDSVSGYASDAYKQAWAGVRQSLFNTAPEYITLMDKYQAVQDGLQNVQKILGTGNRVAANTEMAKFIKQFGDSFGAQEIEKLAKYDPTIPYKVAGASVFAAAGHPSSWTTGLSLAQLGNLGASLFTGNPIHMAGALSGILAQKQLLTPKNVTKIPFYAGEAAGSLPGRAVGAVVEGAGAARPIVQPGLMQLQNAQTDVNEGDEGDKFLTVRLGREYRTGRASGGRTIGHDEISDRLVRMADQVRKQVSTHTEKLLDTPDDHIAKALEIANRDI